MFTWYILLSLLNLVLRKLYKPRSDAVEYGYLIKVFTFLPFIHIAPDKTPFISQKELMFFSTKTYIVGTH